MVGRMKTPEKLVLVHQAMNRIRSKLADHEREQELCDERPLRRPQGCPDGVRQPTGDRGQPPGRARSHEVGGDEGGDSALAGLWNGREGFPALQDGRGD